MKRDFLSNIKIHYVVDWFHVGEVIIIGATTSVFFSSPLKCEMEILSKIKIHRVVNRLHVEKIINNSLLIALQLSEVNGRLFFSSLEKHKEWSFSFKINKIRYVANRFRVRKIILYNCWINRWLFSSLPKLIFVTLSIDFTLEKLLEKFYYNYWR